MKKYKHITILQDGIATDHKFNKPIYRVLNNKSGGELGIIYFNEWKRFVFEPTYDTIFDSSCLKDIIDFLETHAGKE